MAHTALFLPKAGCLCKFCLAGCSGTSSNVPTDGGLWTGQHAEAVEQWTTDCFDHLQREVLTDWPSRPAASLITVLSVPGKVEHTDRYPELEVTLSIHWAQMTTPMVGCT